MYKGNFETNKVIQIIINQEYKIHYSSIGNGRAYNYIKELNILENLSIDSTIPYTSGDYFIYIDRFYIYGQIYYIITISSNSSKCYSCSKVLIDDVTGLYNRSYWEQINGEVQNYLSFKDLFLILIDIDNLKKINDSYGHLEGDKAIKVVGQAIQKSIKRNDIGIRYGGDEFIVLLLNQDKDRADKVIKKIRREIYKQSVEENIDIQVSTGIASNVNSCDIEDIIRIADKDLYKEKKLKKGEKQEEIHKFKELKKQIEKIRNDLNQQIIKKDKMEIFELSQRLDRLIMKYLKDV
ncbi:diguanylate cyclase [Tissierella sp.]|uniref:diguanylate cyclase n=1 Tax=Tissierella sp. TaxID=41274 RepID=UPI0028AD1656|nr:diguanylate cyclase [Tissierella sp.]